MVQQKVAVEPCRKCAEPMEDAKKMAKILVRLAGSAGWRCNHSTDDDAQR